MPRQLAGGVIDLFQADADNQECLMQKELILVVDDEIQILNVIERIFQNSNFEIIKAEGGLKALEILEKEKVDLLLTDARMPGISGVDLLKAYKKRDADAAAVIMTGYGTIDMALEAIAIGAHGFILKPFTHEDLKNTVNSALHKARVFREDVRLKALLPLFEVSRQLMQKLDVDEILESVVRVAKRESGADEVSIILKEGHSFAIRGAGSQDGDINKEESFKMVRKFAGKVIKNGEALLLGGSNQDSADADKAFNKTLNKDISSAMFLPLKIKDEVLGSLNLVKHQLNRSSFGEGDLDFMSILGGQTAAALKNARLASDQEELFIGTVKSLSSAIDAKSPWTAGHSERVTSYSLLMGKEMGLTEDELKNLELAGILHDIGKIGINELVLDKPDKLSDEEVEEIKKHPGISSRLLDPIKQLKDVVPAARHHHERYDGNGYPDSLAGEDIPILARILAVSDTFDAMSADRPYRKGRSIRFIIDEFNRCSGTQFDPKIVDIFLGMLGKSTLSGSLKNVS